MEGIDLFTKEPSPREVQFDDSQTNDDNFQIYGIGLCTHELITLITHNTQCEGHKEDIKSYGMY